MKKSLKKDLREKNLTDFYKELEKTRKELVDLELQRKIGKLANLCEPRNKRKEIALLLTIIEEKKFSEKLAGEKMKEKIAKNQTENKQKGEKNG